MQAERDALDRNHALTVTVDLRAVRSNYDLFRAMCPDAEVAAVVKANAYGCGLAPVASSLDRAGCTTFFVAHLSEAIALRRSLPSAAIYVLNGLLPGSEPAYRNYGVKPVITSTHQLHAWLAFRRKERWLGAAALHLDTGINRLGFRLDEINGLRELPSDDLACFDLVLSHLACADDIRSERNAAQVEAFTWARRVLGVIPRASMASSAGCFLGPAAAFDMVRPGIGLFGGNPFSGRGSPFKPVLSATVPLLQIKYHRRGEYLGYGSDFRLDSDKLVGTVSIGYADGLPRSASSKPMEFFYEGQAIRTIGRISMDMTLVDLTSVRRLAPKLGDALEVIGPSRDVNAMAACLGTIPNEVLTSFGHRSARRFVDQHVPTVELPTEAGSELAVA